MDYSNISVNSNTYKMLSNEEKLKVVRFWLNVLFNDTSKSKAIIYYKGEKRSIDKNKV